ncbi:hypothetical protein ACA910_021357 [Epithemia clementina (nom. ined.)]
MGPRSSPSPPSQPPPDPARELRVKKERRRNLGRSARKRRKKQVELAQLERTLLQRQQKKHEHEPLKNGEAHVDSVVAVETNRNKKEGESSTQSGSRRRGTNALSSLRPVDRQITWPCILELRRRRRTTTTTRQGNNDDHPWWKSPDDETELVSQLGYVPGNAIAIVTRLRNLEQHADPRVQRLFFSTTTTTRNKNNNNNNNDDNNTQEEKPRMFVLDKHNLESPVVLQLFPLALRDEGGGKNSGGGGGQNVKRRTRRKRRRTEHGSPSPPAQPPPLRSTIVLGDCNSHQHDRIQQPLQSLGTVPAVQVNDSLADAPYNPDASVTGASDNHSTNNNNNPWSFTNASTLPINQENNNDNNHNNNNHNDHSNRTIVVEPFPTIYWLTHPMLKLKVSQLEVQGLGLELEERLRQDEPSLQRMFRAHEAYQQERMKLYQQALVFYMTEDENDNARRQGNRDENKETQEAPPPPSQIHSTSTTMKNDIGKEAGEERPMTAKRERRSDEEDDDDREDKSKALVEENHERSANNDHHHHHHHDNMNFHVVVDLDDQEIRQWESIVLDTQRCGGIAGIRNFASIKCLHAHCAHYLSGGPGSQDNVVGQWVVEALVAGGGETATSTATTTTKSARRDKGNCF